MKYLLGIDNGGTFSKAAVFDEAGRQLAVASESVPLLTPRPGFAERDMETLYRANGAAVRRVLEKSGIPASGIACVGLSGHGKGLYLWGRAGKPACHGIVSTDSRADGLAERWASDGTAEKARAKTLQGLLACQQATLLRWLKENERVVYDDVAHVFSVKDYIRFRLTGEAAAEYTDVSGSSLLNLHTKDYDRELLDLYGIPEIAGALPPLRSATEICGRITPEAAALTGLDAGTPVSGGMFDIDACALAAGLVDGGEVVMIAGTWSINEYLSRTPVTDQSIRMNSLYCLDGWYLIEECSPTSAGNLQWFADEILGGADYEAFNREAGSLAPEECDLVYLPFVFGSNENPRMKGGFVGLCAFHRRAHLLRAIYEGVVFSHRTHMDRLLKNRGAPKAVRLAGGAASSPEWTQIFADVLGLPIEVIAEKELGCAGAAIAAGMACGLYGDLTEAVRKTRSVTRTVLPDASRAEIYARKYARYKAIVRALDPVF